MGATAASDATMSAARSGSVRMGMAGVEYSSTLHIVCFEQMLGGLLH
jgi:hypothetical protein